MKYLVTTLVVLLVSIFCIHQAYANSTMVDWTSVELSKKESEFTDIIGSNFGLCKSVNSIDIVSDMEYMNGATLPYKGCIVEGKDIDMYVSPLMDISPDNPRNFAVRTKPNGKFYFLKPGAVSNMQYAQLTPGTNMYTEWRNTPYQRKMVRAIDIRNAIRADRFDSTGNPIRYAFDDSDPNIDTYTFNNIDSSISAGPITKDGKVIFWSGSGWLYKTNLETGVLNVKYMPGQNVNWQNVPYYSSNIHPVDPEGRYVYLGGKLDMLVDTADCGQYYTEIDFMGVPEQVLAEQTNCHMRSFKGMIGVTVNGGQGVFGARIEGSKLQFGAYDFSSDQAKKLFVEFSPEGATDEDTTQLTYLALGDSYSSGEGDNGILFGQKYYRAGTDESGPPREKCHVSTRSYPYLLANAQGLEKNDWNTVACSGALVEKDYHGDGATYLGQGGRLSGLGSGLPQYQADAKSEFIPGRVKQIEFVKKYKPKVVTVTGTGNDADFAPILKACVSASLFESVTEETCSYAGDSRGISMLGAGISRQYDNVRSLVRAIKQESPQTTVYYVGYPQFLKETDNTCGLGVSLSKRERKVFRAATVYLNNVVKAAVESEDAVYVDIEGSLGDHLLCGSGSYVTGYNADCSETVVNWFKGKDECEESFHPKPAGHLLMASAMLAKHPNIMQDQPCAPPRSCTNERGINDVEVPKLFKDAYGQDAKANRVPVRGGAELAAQKGNTNANIYATASNLEANSQFDTYVTSDPVGLGEIWTDDEGNLAITKSVPDSLPAGYHTLHAEGNDSSGKPVELWWIIRIFGKDGDVDEDGIPDDVDKCMFMPTLNRDEDNDGIDDGCDSDIGGSGEWTKFDSNLSLGTTAMNKSLSKGSLSVAAMLENSADHNQGRVRTIDSEENNTKLTASKEHGAGDGILSTTIIGICLLFLSLTAYTIIREGKPNG